MTPNKFTWPIWTMIKLMSMKSPLMMLNNLSKLNLLQIIMYLESISSRISMKIDLQQHKAAGEELPKSTIAIFPASSWITRTQIIKVLVD